MVESKKQLRNAMKQLGENHITTDEKRIAYIKLANFRSAHAYPMQSMLNYFRKKAFEVNKQAIVVSRLKRMPSMIAKVKRFPSMQIDRMGDVGGVRIIMNDMSQVCRLYEKIKAGRSRNQLKYERNYLLKPKASGYRSIHLTYAYQGAKITYHGYQVELQIRSKIQHAWATAVEVVGTFLGESLKSGVGDRAWLDFFQRVSLVFAAREEADSLQIDVGHDFLKQLDDDMHTLNVMEKMAAFAQVTESVSNSKQEASYLLRLNLDENSLMVQSYEKKFLPTAYDDYRRIEAEIAEDSKQDVVLIASSSIKQLKKAYPNYFADTRVFLKLLQELLLVNRNQ